MKRDLCFWYWLLFWCVMKLGEKLGVKFELYVQERRPSFSDPFGQYLKSGIKLTRKGNQFGYVFVTKRFSPSSQSEDL